MTLKEEIKKIQVFKATPKCNMTNFYTTVNMENMTSSVLVNDLIFMILKLVFLFLFQSETVHLKSPLLCLWFPRSCIARERRH